MPAREAWREYGEAHAYACQTRRSFRPVTRIAFYTDGQIQPLLPLILGSPEAVPFKRGLHAGRLGAVIDQLLKSDWREEGTSYKVLLLTSPDDERTIRLPGPVVNDLTTEGGRPVAFTQNQRYVELAALRKARTTSQLVGA